MCTICGNYNTLPYCVSTLTRYSFNVELHVTRISHLRIVGATLRRVVAERNSFDTRNEAFNQRERCCVTFVGLKLPGRDPPAPGCFRVRYPLYGKTTFAREGHSVLARASRILHGDEPEVENLRWRELAQARNSTPVFSFHRATSRGIVP